MKERGALYTKMPIILHKYGHFEIRKINQLRAYLDPNIYSNTFLMYFNCSIGDLRGQSFKIFNQNM